MAADKKPLIADPVVEKAVRTSLKKRTGELTESDLEKVSRLRLSRTALTDEGLKDVAKLMQLTDLWLNNNQLTDVKGLENLTQLKELHPSDNPDLTKAQIAALQKALPKCYIESNPTK